LFLRAVIRFRPLHPVALALAAMLAAAPASAFETEAQQAILVDLNTDNVLFAKKPDESVAPASMAKMMTLYLVFEALDEGRLGLDDTFLVSEKAWRKGGSKMWVEVGNRVRVEDLIRGIVVQSGNDASIVVAEGMAGSEEAFAREMTRKAEALGMENSVFRTSTGWPDPEQHTTVRDLAILSEHLVEDFPRYYDYFAEREFTWSGIPQPNRNALLGFVEGVDGLKTGHTEESGYGIAISAERDGRRLVAVVHGLDSEGARSRAAERLIEWGFREFEIYRMLSAGEQVEEAEVWRGDADTVPLVAPADFTVSLPRAARDRMKATVHYDGPIPAPIAEGDPIAKLVITAPNMEPIETPLVAGADVPEQGFFGRIGTAILTLVGLG